MFSVPQQLADLPWIPNLPQERYSQESHRKYLSSHLQTCSPCTSQSQQFWCDLHCLRGHCLASSLCGGREGNPSFRMLEDHTSYFSRLHLLTSSTQCLHVALAKKGWGLSDELLSWTSIFLSSFCISGKNPNHKAATELSSRWQQFYNVFFFRNGFDSLKGGNFWCMMLLRWWLQSQER